MRFVFLVADLETRERWWQLQKTIHFLRLRALEDFIRFKFMRVDVVFGGTLNIMRHCWVAQNNGAEAVLATMSGKDSYGARGIPSLSYIRWEERRPDDVCIVPDFVSELADDVQGRVIVYLQSPWFIKNNFDYQNERVTLWTDSPFMLEKCQQVYPGKEIQLVPNIISDQQFPLIPQAQREPGLLFAFPRKGAEYIDQAEQLYQEMGGQYWHFERISGLSIHELAQQFKRPQVFLASAEVEGCALPPQESMASGIVVVGKNARGANFCMEHQKTAMIAPTPEDAARALIALENAELRDTLSHNAYQSIKRYFPSEEPSAFWQKNLQYFSGKQLSGAPDPVRPIRLEQQSQSREYLPSL